MSVVMWRSSSVDSPSKHAEIKPFLLLLPFNKDADKDSWEAMFEDPPALLTQVSLIFPKYCTVYRVTCYALAVLPFVEVYLRVEKGDGRHKCFHGFS